MNNEFKKIKESLASLDKKFQEVKAQMPENDKYGDLMEICYSMVSNLRNYVYAVEDQVWEHKSQNHVPPLNAAAMEKFLKVVGMDGQYKIQPPVLYIKANRQNKVEFQVELTNNKKV